MIETFNTYIYSLAHPFYYHDEIKNNILMLEKPLKRNSLFEFLSVSWVFVTMSSIIRLSLYNLSVFFALNLITQNFDFIKDIIPSQNFSAHYFFIISAVLDVIFFPLYTLISIEVWQFFINFFGYVKGIDKTLRKQAAEEIVKASLSSHLLLIIPLFGDIAQKISSFVSMYAGIRKHLEFSRLETIIVLVFPTVILLGTVTIFILLLMMLIM
jgi:hypothetical protein